jgi:hypothetical protein
VATNRLTEQLAAAMLTGRQMARLLPFFKQMPSIKIATNMVKSPLLAQEA